MIHFKPKDEENQFLIKEIPGIVGMISANNFRKEEVIKVIDIMDTLKV